MVARGGFGELENLARVVQQWNGKGACDDTTGKHIQNYLKRVPPGPTRNPKKSPPPRWQSGAAALVAGIVKRSGPALRRLIFRDETPHEELETLVAGCSTVAGRFGRVQELNDCKEAERRAKDAHRQAAKRLTEEKAAAKAKQVKATKAAIAAKKELKARIKEARDRATEKAKEKWNATRKEVRAELRPAALDAARGIVKAGLSRSAT